MSIKFNIPTIQFDITPIIPLLEKAIIKELALIHADIQKKRQSGIAADDTKFRQYSKQYIKQILAGNIKFKGSTVTNLTQTGEFNRSSLVQKISDKSYGIKISSLRNLKIHDYLTDKGFEPIFTLSDEHQEQLLKAVETVINNNIDKILK